MEDSFQLPYLNSPLPGASSAPAVLDRAAVAAAKNRSNGLWKEDQMKSDISNALERWRKAIRQAEGAPEGTAERLILEERAQELVAEYRSAVDMASEALAEPEAQAGPLPTFGKGSPSGAA